MCWVMPPGVVRAAISISCIGPVIMAYKIIIPVDIDVVITAPSAIPSPTAMAPCCTDRYSHAKAKQHAPRGIGRIRKSRIRIVGRAPDHPRIIAGYIDNFCTGRLDNDNGLVLDNFGFHFLLLS